MKDYWKKRATKYHKLDWVNSEESLKELLEFCDLKSTDCVLDAGCGTGVLIPYLAERVKIVEGFDSSGDMLLEAMDKGAEALSVWDIYKSFAVHVYNKIISRMVFHHLTDVNKALHNCYTALKSGGWMIIEEGGILPEESTRVRDWFANMMAYKEERTNFTKNQLVEFLSNNGFSNITYRETVNSNFSIKNWLKNSGQSQDVQDIIYKIHLTAPDYVKEAYKMRIDENDIIIQTRILFIKGQKV